MVSVIRLRPTCYFHQVYPIENCTLAFTPGLESPMLAFEICTAFAEMEID
jgi:hypothetical protein